MWGSWALSGGDSCQAGQPRHGSAELPFCPAGARQGLDLELLLDTKLKRSHLSPGKAGRKIGEVQAHVACKQLHLLPS